MLSTIRRWLTKLNPWDPSISEAELDRLLGLLAEAVDTHLRNQPVPEYVEAFISQLTQEEPGQQKAPSDMQQPTSTPPLEQADNENGDALHRPRSTTSPPTHAGPPASGQPDSDNGRIAPD